MFGIQLLSRVRLFVTSSSRVLYPWDFPGKITGVGCHFVLQGIFLTQGSNPRLLLLLHCRWILNCLSHQRNVLAENLLYFLLYFLIPKGCIGLFLSPNISYLCFLTFLFDDIHRNLWILKLFRNYFIVCVVLFVSILIFSFFSPFYFLWVYLPSFVSPKFFMWILIAHWHLAFRIFWYSHLKTCFLSSMTIAVSLKFQWVIFWLLFISMYFPLW